MLEGRHFNEILIVMVYINATQSYKVNEPMRQFVQKKQLLQIDLKNCESMYALCNRFALVVSFTKFRIMRFNINLNILEQLNCILEDLN